MNLVAVVADAATTTITTTTRAVTTVQATTTLSGGSGSGGEGFWSSFWPGFAATLFGVLMGIPIALWLDRRTQRQAEQERQREREARMRDVARLLVESLRANAERLQQVATSPRASGVPAFSEVELASWSALRNDAFDLIRSTELKRDLARHFERVARIISMDEERRRQMVARLYEGPGESQEAREHRTWLNTWEEQRLEGLKDRAAEACEEAGKLADRLEEVQKER